MNETFKKTFPSIIILLLIIAYWPLLFAQQTVDPDAQIIIPNLESFNGVIDYCHGLVNLQTIDFQPIRDLTLSIDLFIFNHFGFSSIILQNLLWWLACIYVGRRILTKFIDDDRAWGIIALFSIYPLFVPVVGWGMSRKHVVAFFFILMATQEVLSNTKNYFKISLYYFLSLLAQPIHILWPVWMIVYELKFNRLNAKEVLKKSYILGIVFLLMTACNYHYYEYSQVFRHHFPDKTDSAFLFADKLLAFGHYIFQIFLPYSLSFKYSLGDFQVLMGLGIFLLICLVLYKKKNRFLSNWHFIILMILPIIVVLNTPHVLSDSYLLLPTFACFVLISAHLKSIKPKQFLGFLIISSFVFMILSYTQASHWTDPVQLTKASFASRQNCPNAVNHMRISYEFGKSVDAETKAFFKENECLKLEGKTAYNSTSIANLIGHISFYEEDMPLNQRIDILQKLSRNNMITHLTLAGLYIKKGMEAEAKSTLSEIINRAQGISISGKEYHLITAEVVQPFCEKNNWEACLILTKKLSQKKKRTYL